jgi:hypothetical protein
MVGGIDRDDVRSGFGLSIDAEDLIGMMFDRALGYRSMLMILWFCRSLVVGDSIVVMFDRALGYRSMLMILWFCRSLVVGEFDRDDVRSGFGFSIDVDVLSIDCGEGIRCDDVRSGFGVSIDVISLDASISG